MANVQLRLSESQVLSLVRQLSPKVKRTVLQMLASELGDLDDLEDEEDLFEPWDTSDVWDEEAGMDRRQLLAAETFHYSYAHYAGHLGINVRFDELMPHNVDTLEQAEQEGWDDARLAQALEIEEEHVKHWRLSYQRAKAIVDALTPAEAFRRGVRFSIQDAIEEGLTDEKAIEQLVTQVCYRAADLAYVLDMRGEVLSDYSLELRQVPADVDFDQ